MVIYYKVHSVGEPEVNLDGAEWRGIFGRISASDAMLDIIFWELQNGI